MLKKIIDSSTVKVSAAVHLDETIPHMHLIYIPVIHTKDKDENETDKICCRDFWKSIDSYRQLQNAFHKYITQLYLIK